MRGDQPRLPVVAVAAAVGGVLLGALDFVWIRYVPWPFGGLGNSSAVWAVAAFFFGHWVRAGHARAAAGAVVLLVLAVPSYYVAATLIQRDDLSVAWSVPALVWMVFGVLAGVVFGIAGVWARGAGWRQTIGVAMPGAVLFAEALLQVRWIGDPDRGDDPVPGIVLNLVLGVLVIVLAGHGLRQRVRALAVAVPLALLGLAGFLAGGFA